MKHNKVNVIGRFYVIMLFLLSAMLLAACAGEPAADVSPTAAEEQETRPPVQVKMPDYEFTYSGTLSDVIAFNELADSNVLEFTVKTSQEEYTIFIMHFNAAEGDLVEFLTDAKGNKIPVAFEMTPIPEGLKEDDASLFFLAQESVNDIVASIKLK